MNAIEHGIDQFKSFHRISLLMLVLPASVACLRHHKDFGEMEGDHPLRGLVMSCLEYDPTLRPTASDIVQQLKSQELETGA